MSDLTVRLGPAHPLVDRALVRSGRTAFLVDWDDVAELTASHVSLKPGARLQRTATSGPSLRADEILLARDVLDTQVVNLSGHGLARVADVLMVDHGGGLEVVGVDVGLRTLLRRIVPGRLAGNTPSETVDWQDLHLTSTRGHLAQLRTTTAAFRKLDARGLAELLARLGTESASQVVQAVPPAHAAAAMDHAHPHTTTRILRALGAEDARPILEAAPDPASRLIEIQARGTPVRGRRFRRTAGWRRYPPTRSGGTRRPRRPEGG